MNTYRIGRRNPRTHRTEYVSVDADEWRKRERKEAKEAAARSTARAEARAEKDRAYQHARWTDPEYKERRRAYMAEYRKRASGQ